MAEPEYLDISVDADVSNADFSAILIGDVTGNWTANGSRVDAAASATRLVLSAPAEATSGVFSIDVLITQPESAAIRSLEFEIAVSGGASITEVSVDVESDWLTESETSNANRRFTFVGAGASALSNAKPISLLISVPDNQQTVTSANGWLNESQQVFSTPISLILDDDGDGVANDDDYCANSGTDASPDEWGCTPSQVTDSDGDGLSDGQEWKLGTNPNSADTDGDGWSDSEELEEGTDPLLASSQPEINTGLPIWLLIQAIQ